LKQAGETPPAALDKNKKLDELFSFTKEAKPKIYYKLNSEETIAEKRKQLEELRANEYRRVRK